MSLKNEPASEPLHISVKLTHSFWAAHSKHTNARRGGAFVRRPDLDGFNEENESTGAQLEYSRPRKQRSACGTRPYRCTSLI